MKSILLAALLAAASVPAVAGTCAGPAFCDSTPADPSPPVAEPGHGPGQLCLSAESGCVPIVYLKQVVPGPAAGPAAPPYFALALSSVDGYPVLGWAGPCLSGWECPAIYDAAYADLRAVALKARRNIRYANGSGNP